MPARRRRPSPRHLVAWSPVLLLVVAGCTKPASNNLAPPAPGGDTGPARVAVASPKRQAIRWAIEQPGVVQAFEVTPVVAKLAGFVKSIGPDPAAGSGAVVDIGSEVTAGQTLAVIDIPELVEEAAGKRAAVKLAAAEVEQYRKAVAVADAQTVAAEALQKEAEAAVGRTQADVERWQSELARLEDLVARRVVDPLNRDETLRQFRSAEATRLESQAKVASGRAAVLEAKARRDRAAADVAAAEAKVAVADADARRTEALVGYTTVPAPFAGTVTARNVHPGHFLQPNAPLFTVVRLDPVRVFVDVPEAAAEKARPGAKATVRVPALDNREFPAAVSRTTGVINPDSRTLRVEIDLPNPAPSPVKPGMYAFARIEAETAEAVVVPAACVLPADETHYCFLVEAGKAVKYRVQVGRGDAAVLEVRGRRRASAAAGAWEPFTGAEAVVNGNLGAIGDGQAVEVK